MSETRYDLLIRKFQVKFMIDALLPEKDSKPNEQARPTVGDDWQLRFRTPTWDAFKAIQTLGLKHAEKLNEAAEKHSEGVTNAEGVWLRPDALYPAKVAAHELAHNVLGHVAETDSHIEKGKQVDDLIKKLWAGHKSAGIMAAQAATSVIGIIKDVDETEAELTAFLVADALNIVSGAEWDTMFQWTHLYMGGYAPVLFVDSAKVKKAADQILAAGRIAEAEQKAA